VVSAVHFPVIEFVSFFLAQTIVFCRWMPAAGSSVANLYRYGKVFLSHRPALDVAVPYLLMSICVTCSWYLRQEVGSGPRRCIIDIVIPRHVLGYDGYFILSTLCEKQRSCQTRYTSSTTFSPVQDRGVKHTPLPQLWP